MIKYKPNPHKVIEALVYVAKKCPGRGFHFVLKTLYFADKLHLQRYGRPVLGDTYIKMSFGPVGSLAYDFLKLSDFAPLELLDVVERALRVERDGKKPKVHAQRDFNPDLFSKTDLEVLEEASNHCSRMDFNTRTMITHDEPAWVEAQMRGEMDYELILDEDAENRDELLEYIRETSHSIAF